MKTLLSLLAGALMISSAVQAANLPADILQRHFQLVGKVERDLGASLEEIEGFRARGRFDPADTGGDAAFGGNHESCDISGAGDMGAAAGLQINV